jgi:hypothetical protein
MATADEYAAWIVKNADKRGTPEFDTVAAAYKAARGGESADWQGSSNQETPKVSAPMQMLQNIPGSAANFAGGIWQSVAHPIDTASNMLDLGAGALRNLTPAPLRGAIDSIDPNPQAAQRATGVADAAGQLYKDRYGGLQSIKNTVVADPIGAAADLSTLFGIGGGIAGIAGASKTAGALNAASKYTNPLSVIAPAARAVGTAAKHGVGLLTGTGAENVGQAAKSGYLADRSFLDNLTGESSMTDVLTKAKEGLQNMRADRSGAYRQGIASTAADTTKLKFAPIDQALADVTDSMKFGGKWKIGPAEVAKVKEVDNVVRQWRMDEALHTPMGLDALKQRLDAIYPDSPVHNQAQRAITSVRNAVKDTIVKQSPDYAQTMAGYETAIGIEKEIERALSLGDRASADTAMRKLQSLSRNNVNTNYGNRLDLAKVLEDQGGVNLLPAIAGQAMNSWTPRGLAGLGGTATAISSFSNPSTAMLLPLQSPKVAGMGAYVGGRVSGVVARALEKAGITPERAKALGLLGYQLGQDREQGK